MVKSQTIEEKEEEEQYEPMDIIVQSERVQVKEEEEKIDELPKITVKNTKKQKEIRVRPDVEEKNKNGKGRNN